MEHGFGFSGGIPQLYCIIFPILCILFCLFFKGRHFMSSGSHWRQGDNDQDALSLLKQRYAKGEITTEQYREMKNELQR